MSTKLQELLAQKVALEKQITELQAAEKSEAVSKIRTLIAEYGLSQEDIFGRSSSTKTLKTSSTKVAAKYRDTDSGKEWSGRGIAPKWLAGKNKVDYLIA